jgi:hypothetical protein
MPTSSIDVHAASFAPYGRVLDYDTAEAVAYLETKTPMPKEKNLYVRDDEAFRQLPIMAELQEAVYGTLPLEAGYCNGYNSLLNCLEYHSCPEVDIAGSDLVLHLALQNDVKAGQIDSKDVRAFFVKKGTAVLLYPGVFHFSPCKLSLSGFKCAIILSAHTNEPLDEKAHDPRLWMKNKWLFAHPDSLQASKGAYIGIKGANIEVK